ncbi:hypothetical protein E2P81_ATG03581 [Venturia nashicola]|nr:hypothetical protein E2P81_ATG03581 [Venturia nashicola]
MALEGFSPALKEASDATGTKARDATGTKARSATGTKARDAMPRSGHAPESQPLAADIQIRYPEPLSRPVIQIRHPRQMPGTDWSNAYSTYSTTLRD